MQSGQIQVASHEGAYLITSAYENGYEPAEEFLEEYDLWGM